MLALAVVAVMGEGAGTTAMVAVAVAMDMVAMMATGTPQETLDREVMAMHGQVDQYRGVRGRYGDGGYGGRGGRGYAEAVATPVVAQAVVPPPVNVAPVVPVAQTVLPPPVAVATVPPVVQGAVQVVPQPVIANLPVASVAPAMAMVGAGQGAVSVAGQQAQHTTALQQLAAVMV